MEFGFGRVKVTDGLTGFHFLVVGIAGRDFTQLSLLGGGQQGLHGTGGGHISDQDKQKHAQGNDPGPGVVGADEPLPEAGAFDGRDLVPGQSVYPLLECGLDGLHKVLYGAGLFQVPEHIVFAGDTGRLGRAESCMHDHLHLRPDLFDLLEGLDAVHAGHFLVQNHDMRVVVPYDFDGVFTAASIQHMKIADTQLMHQPLAKFILIVN